MHLYEKPANVFVAGFFGSPAMNFFRGILSRDGSLGIEGHAPLLLGDLATAHVDLASYPGREIVVGLRPEDLHLAADDAQAPGFLARLDYIEPIGNEVFLNLRFADRDLVARLPPRPLPAPGSSVRMSFSPTRLNCFDATSGLRLPDGLSASRVPGAPLQPPRADVPG